MVLTIGPLLFEVIKKEYPAWCYVDFSNRSRDDAIYWEGLMRQWLQEPSSEQSGSQPAAPTLGSCTWEQAWQLAARGGDSSDEDEWLVVAFQ